MMIPEYTKIDGLGHRKLASLFDGTAYVEEKIDGCVQYGSRIMLADGTTQSIGYLVNNQVNTDVLTYDTDNDRFLSKPIVCYGRHSSTPTDWLQIITERRAQRGQATKKVIVTKNHPMLTPNGFVQADKLTVGDRLVCESQSVHYLAKQMILGSLLGDGNLKSSGSFRVSHSEAQHKVVELAASLVQPLGGTQDTAISGYGSSMSRISSRACPELYDLYTLCYPDNTKQVTREWLNLLDPVALSWWYMDDGSLSVGANGQLPKARLHTEGFSKEECEVIQTYFYERWGLLTSVLSYKNGKYYYISFDTESSTKFFCLVAPYIIKDLQYKLPTYLRTGYSFWDNMDIPATVERSANGLKILDIRQPPTSYDPSLQMKYDIEVADTHNFIANDYIVHNSQFSFAKIDGVLHARSKKQQLDMDAPTSLFGVACETVRALGPLLNDGWIYRGEYLSRPKHNTIAYDRVPIMNVMLFDVETEAFGQHYLTPEQKQQEAERLGLECVPLYSQLTEAPTNSEELHGLFVNRVSVLGGDIAEGIVLKNYDQYGPDGKILIAKIVRADFKEKNSGNWKSSNPTQRDVLTEIANQLRSQARWRKAVQHVRESGLLTDTPKDIGLLIQEVLEDIKIEEGDWIRSKLFTWAWKTISREVVKGLPSWYKDQLLNDALEEVNDESVAWPQDVICDN